MGEHAPPFLSTVTYCGDDGAPTLVLPLEADERGHALLLLKEYDDALKDCAIAIYSQVRVVSHTHVAPHVATPHSMDATRPHSSERSPSRGRTTARRHG